MIERFEAGLVCTKGFQDCPSYQGSINVPFLRRRPRVQVLLADSEEATVVIPVVVVEPVQAQAALGTAPVEVGNAAVAATARPDRTEGDDRELTLDFGIGTPEGEEFLDGCGAEALLVEFGECVVGRDRTVEVNELSGALDHAVPIDREVLGRDVRILPVVGSCLDHLFESLAVVDGDGVGDDVLGTWDDEFTTEEALCCLHSTQLVENGFDSSPPKVCVLVFAHHDALL